MDRATTKRVMRALFSSAESILIGTPAGFVRLSQLDVRSAIRIMRGHTQIIAIYGMCMKRRPYTPPAITSGPEPRMMGGC